VVSPSFRVKTVLELIAYAKANPGKITMASRFSVRPPVAPTKLEDFKQRDPQLEPLRAEQRKALEKCGAAQVARSNSIGDDRRKFNQQIIDIIMVNS
jgi:hypothetical protein